MKTRRDTDSAMQDMIREGHDHACRKREENKYGGWISTETWKEMKRNSDMLACNCEICAKAE